MIVEVIHKWDDKYGTCYDCGAPAAYDAIGIYNRGTSERFCSVCAAHYVYLDPSLKLEWLFEEPITKKV